MQKFLKVIVCSVFIFSAFLQPITKVNAFASGSINQTKLFVSNTVVQGSVDVTAEADSQVALMVKKNESVKWHDMDIKGSIYQKKLWLNSGEGEYEINLMIPIGGNYYRFGPKVSVYNNQVKSKFTSPDKYIESNSKEVKELAYLITRNAKNDYQKAKMIFDWVSENVVYDVDKYRKIIGGNYDNDYGALVALKAKKGICLDFATLVAALGRASGLQTKLIKGDYISASGVQYHAWNEMFISEEGRWIKGDVTLASIYGKNFLDIDGFDKNHVKQTEE